MGNTKSIWWLVGWYPNSLDREGGNFVCRHAAAFAQYQMNLASGLGLLVFHFPVYRLWRDKMPTSIVKSDKFDSICTPIPQFALGGAIFAAIDYWIYTWLSGRILRRYTQSQGIPSGVHVHAGDKVARLIPALYAVFRKQNRGAVPLWYTEHWAIFNEIVFDRFDKRGWIFRRDFSRLWEKVTVAAPVSLSAHASMQRYLGGAKPFVLFRNVVDTGVFRKISGLERTKGKDGFTFLHVSSLEPRKNVAGILRAFAQLKLQFPSIALELRIVGGGNERFLSEARTVAVALGLLHVVNPSIRFMGNLNSEAVALEMQNADVLVLFSEMENAPCVISEALCCGLPVISSAVAGIPEMLNEGNGLMVDSGNEKGLVVAMAKAIEANGIWEREKIADVAQRMYGFDAVGGILSESYRNLM